MDVERFVSASTVKSRLWHGSSGWAGSPDPSSTVDGGLHAGTFAQASMRSRAQMVALRLDVSRVRRCRDRGGGWRDRISDARSRGFDAIVYLNRYEGLGADRIDDLARRGLLPGLDSLDDAAFRRLVPEAGDSWIVWDPGRILVEAVLDKEAASSPGFDPDGLLLQPGFLPSGRRR
jgi:hypothetical protein